MKRLLSHNPINDGVYFIENNCPTEQIMDQQYVKNFMTAHSYKTVLQRYEGNLTTLFSIVDIENGLIHDKDKKMVWLP